MGTVEVETAESVNHLEAMAQWAHLGRARAPFHLYVPAGSVDIARRLASENQVNVAEIWSYHTIGDQTRFTLVYRAPAAEPRRAAAENRRAAAESPPRGRRDAPAAPAAPHAPAAAPPTRSHAPRRRAGRNRRAEERRAFAKSKPPARKTAARAQKRK